MSEEKILNSQINALEDQALEGVSGGIHRNCPDSALPANANGLANGAPDGSILQPAPENFIAQSPLGWKLPNSEASPDKIKH